MTSSPDDGAERSVAEAGDCPREPERVVSVVVTDEDDDPAGVLEKWNASTWLYADVSALQELKP